MDADAPSLLQWLERHPGGNLRLVLSSRLVHPLLVREAGLARAREADRRAWARQQFLHYYGPEAADWPIVLAADAPWVCAVALHGADLSAWQAAARQHGTRLASLQPVWSTLPQGVAAALPGWPGDDAAGLLVAEGEHASWLRFECGHLVAVAQRRAAAPGVAALAALLAEWQQETGIAPDVTAICGFGVAGGQEFKGGDAVPNDITRRGRVIGDLCAPQPGPMWAAP